MIDNIIKYSLRNKLVILFIFLLVVVSGGYIIQKIDIDIFPDLNAPTVVVMTEATGMAPEEVEKMVTFPIETAVNGASGIRRIRSSSAMGYSIVWVEFKWGVDVYDARQTVTEKLMIARERMPEGVSEAVIAPQSSLLGEILIFSISSDTLSDMELRTFAEWHIRPRILSVGGIAQVTVHGGENKEYQVLPDHDKLKYYHVSFKELLEACQSSNDNAPGGFINQYGKKYIIRGLARTTDIKEIGKTVIRSEKGQAITVGDVAEVKIGHSPKIGTGSYNAQDAVVIIVTKQPEVNTVKITGKLKTLMSEIEKENTELTVNKNIYEQAEFINIAVNNVKKVLIEGSFFVFIVLFLFLFNVRTTVISLISIPVSLLITIIIMKLLGQTINTMSLGGMAIAIGSLVDDAIIDVENVFKRLRENFRKDPDQREAVYTVVYGASKEIRTSIMNATFIIIIAFVPLFFLTGFEGRMLKPLGISYIVALFSSLMVALTLTPVLCSLLLTKDKFLHRSQKGSVVENKLRSIYSKALAYSLSHKKLVLGSVIILFVASILLMTSFGRSFLPPFNEGSLTINLASIPEISLEESDKLGKEAETSLLEIDEVVATLRKTGRAELAEHSFGDNVSEIEVPFKLKDRSRSAFLEDVRRRLKSIPGLVVTVGQPISHRIDHLLSGSQANIAIKLFGNDTRSMYLTAKHIEQKISGIPGVADVSVEQQVEIPQIVIQPKRLMLAKYGITITEFNHYIQHNFNGVKVSDVFEEEKSFDMVIRLDEPDRNRIEEIQSLLMDGEEGKVPLGQLALISSSSGPTTIQRENVQRKLVVSVNVEGRDIVSTVQEINETIEAEIKLDDDMRLEYGGQFESAEEASRILLFASILSIMLIYVVLYQEFKKLGLAAIILLNLPLALIGGVFSIYFSSGVLDIPAIIGFITLFGIATRNGLLLISRYQQLKLEGYGLREIILTGSEDRLIPILMTALTAALALIPLALATTDPGNEIQSPMAKVILGGLISSTFLNIFIIPVTYYIIHRRKAD